MIKHIVLFRFKNKEEEFPVAKKMLDDLFETVEGCAYYKITGNITPMPTGYDLIIDCAFESRDYLNTYQKCPKHMEFVKYAGSIDVQVAELDYEEYEA